MAKQQPAEPVSSGVDALIARLREDGVSAGRSDAEQIVADARAQAKRILDEATAEAKSKLETAHRESDAYRSAGEQALKSAMRDAVLEMKAQLMDRFSADVKRLVSHDLADPEMLRRMILEVAGRAQDRTGLDEAEALDVILPESAVGMEELRGDPDELQKGRLTGFVLGLTGEMMRDGVTFSASDDMGSGVRVHVAEKEITVDLTDEAVADLLLKHLQPRFRAILEGIVR